MKLNNIRILEIIESIKNTDLFSAATTHKSFLKTNPNLRSYEELIPFGDEILDTFITTFLEFIHNNNLKLGDLDKTKSKLIQPKILKLISENINLSNHLKTNYKKSSFVNLDIFKSFLVALYFEKGPVILFEFLTLTVLNKYEFKDKFQDFNPNLVPKIPMKGIINEIKNPQIIDTSNLINQKLPIQNLAPFGVKQNYNEIIHSNNFVNSSESKIIFERLTKLEQSISDQIHYLEKISNNLTPKISNSELKESDKLDELTRSQIIAKTTLTIFNLLALFTVIISILLLFYQSDVYPDDSSFQLIKNLSNKIKVNSDNKLVEDISIDEDPIINENPLNIEKIRSLYIKDLGNYFNSPVIKDDLIIEDEPLIENEVEQESALLNLILAGFGVIALYQLQKFAIFALIKFPLNFLNNSPRIGIDAEIPDLIEVTERGLNPSLISEILKKSKEILNIGIDHLDILGANPAVSVITANVIGVLFSLLDPLEIPLEKPEDIDLINYISVFDKDSNFEDLDLSNVNNDTDSEISEDSFDISDYIETRDITVEITVEEEIEQMDQSTQYNDTSEIQDLQDTINYQNNIINSQKATIDSQSDSIKLLDDELDQLNSQAKVSVNDKVDISTQTEVQISSIENALKELQDKYDSLEKDMSKSDKRVELYKEYTEELKNKANHASDMVELQHKVIRKIDSNLDSLYEKLNENRDKFNKGEIILPKFIKNKLDLLEDYVKGAGSGSVYESIEEEEISTDSKDNTSSNSSNPSDINNVD